nr:TniQ family protein [uncultured Roseovarius sp.]
MTVQCLQPTIPFHDDEVTQGYFARIGHFQTGADAGRFCRFFDLARADFRKGNSQCIEVIAAISGESSSRLKPNVIQQDTGDMLRLRGELLGLPMVRRVSVRFCPRCLMADEDKTLSLGRAAWRFRWSWLLKPVVACPDHNIALVTVAAKDPVNAFDLQKLLAQNHLDLTPQENHGPLSPGSLQRYVLSRLNGHERDNPWLDGQDLAQGVRACEMVGSLVTGGPTADIKSYTEVDWANVGSAGFDICSLGPTAIRDALSKVRIDAGCRSGRTGPQAAFGQLFNWLKKTERSGDEGPIRDVVREAILENFSIGPGEMVLGEIVDRRKMHSVNSLTNATGLTRYRLYRIMRKARLILDEDNDAALNQRVFPAEEAEAMIARIQNSIPQNRIQGVLGCSKTHAEQLVRSGLISSVVPMTEGDVGLTRGDFNLDDLSGFLDSVCVGTQIMADEVDGFANLTHAARGRSSTAEIIGWHVAGRLKQTGLLNGIKRLDHLRFRLSEIRHLVAVSRGHNLHRLTAVAQILGTNLGAVKRLVSSQRGGPWLGAVPANMTHHLSGKAYVSSTEIDRFKERYATLGLVARSFSMNHRTARTVVEANGAEPVIDPDWLGARVYRRADIDAQADNLLLVSAEKFASRPETWTAPETASFDAKKAKMT